MPTIYDVINVLPFEAHHWFFNAKPLSEIFGTAQIKTVIEVGSWFGGSTRWFAKQLPEDGYVIAVDTWKGSVEHQPGANCHHQKLEQLYQQFLSNCVHEKIDHKIIPLRMDSLEAAAAVKIQPDLFYLDAAHDEESVYKDLQAWGSKLKDTTIICGDDYNWPGVKAAVDRYAEEQGFSKVISIGPLWILV